MTFHLRYEELLQRSEQGKYSYVVNIQSQGRKIEENWATGIMVAGGYKSHGAWTNTVEFFNFETGKWVPPAFFPQLTDGRHYHGVTTLGLIPTVFGGWNNGSLDSIEQLDYCTEGSTKWTKFQ